MRRVVVIPFVGVGSEEYLSQSIYDTGYHIKKVGCIIFLHFDYLSWYSVGLPRVSKQNSKLVLIQNCQTKVYRWIFRQFTVH